MNEIKKLAEKIKEAFPRTDPRYEFGKIVVYGVKREMQRDFLTFIEKEYLAMIDQEKNLPMVINLESEAKGDSGPSLLGDSRVPKTIEEKLALAEDIISQCMADEETRWRTATENGGFYSLHFLNKCRGFFNMDPID